MFYHSLHSVPWSYLIQHDSCCTVSGHECAQPLAPDLAFPVRMLAILCVLTDITCRALSKCARPPAWEAAAASLYVHL